MKIAKTISITTDSEVVVSKVCNKCGATHEPNEENEFMNIHKSSIEFEGEYNKYRSKCWWFDLCDECLVEFVKTFKHTPDWFRGGIGDSAQKEFEEWVDGGCKNISRFY